jgi:hypothetical protein
MVVRLNSGDSGGVLQDDWQTLDQAKLTVMKEYQARRLDKPAAQIARLAVTTRG